MVWVGRTFGGRIIIAVRGADDQLSAWAKYAPALVQEAVLFGEVFDCLERGYDVEGSVRARQNACIAGNESEVICTIGRTGVRNRVRRDLHPHDAASHLSQERSTVALATRNI